MSLGRTPSPVPGFQSIIADLLDPGAIQAALQGADVAYFTAGLPYSAHEWETKWPKMLESSINACITHETLLVYLDNPYAYGRTNGLMTEKNQIHPTSRKGKVRAAALGLLDEAARSRGLNHTVGRSADFYGPGATTSVFNTFALEKVAAGKKPTWLFDATQPHSLTYTRDIGDALVVLGTDPRAPGREWHLPTARPALTGEQYMSIAAGGRRRPSHDECRDDENRGGFQQPSPRDPRDVVRVRRALPVRLRRLRDDLPYAPDAL